VLSRLACSSIHLSSAGVGSTSVTVFMSERYAEHDIVEPPLSFPCNLILLDDRPSCDAQLRAACIV
jgi:hypothetical protein